MAPKERTEGLVDQVPADAGTIRRSGSESDFSQVDSTTAYKVRKSSLIG